MLIGIFFLIFVFGIYLLVAFSRIYDVLKEIRDILKSEHP